MKVPTLLSVLAVSALASLPVFGAAQRSLHIDPDHFKVHPRQAAVHPRRLAFNNKDGRHQPRVLSHHNRHVVRKNVRGVTHHLTAPHHPRP